MELLTKKEVAAQFKVTPQTIDRWAKRGILKKLNPGGNTRAVRFSREELNKVFKSN